MGKFMQKATEAHAAKRAKEKRQHDARESTRESKRAALERSRPVILDMSELIKSTLMEFKESTGYGLTYLDRKRGKWQEDAQLRRDYRDFGGDFVLEDVDGNVLLNEWILGATKSSTKRQGGDFKSYLALSVGVFTNNEWTDGEEEAWYDDALPQMRLQLTFYETSAKIFDRMDVILPAEPLTSEIDELMEVVMAGIEMVTGFVIAATEKFNLGASHADALQEGARRVVEIYKTLWEQDFKSLEPGRLVDDGQH